MTIVVPAWELAVLVLAAIVALLCGTRGTLLGMVWCMVGAWLHEPLVLALGAMWCWATLPDGSSGGGDNGRHKHA